MFAPLPMRNFKQLILLSEAAALWRGVVPGPTIRSPFANSSMSAPASRRTSALFTQFASTAMCKGWLRGEACKRASSPNSFTSRLTMSGLPTPAAISRAVKYLCLSAASSRAFSFTSIFFTSLLFAPFRMAWCRAGNPPISFLGLARNLSRNSLPAASSASISGPGGGAVACGWGSAWV